jgi:nitrate reductase beta subunit
LLLFGSTNKIIHRFSVDDTYAYGYDEAGEELARVPFTEPLFVRPFYDSNYQVYRHNTP